MSFQASELSDIKLSHLKGKKNGTFTVKGKVKWVDAVKQREVNDKQKGTIVLNVRDDVIADETAAIPMSFLESFIETID